MQDNTKAFYGESIGNPKNNVVDIRKISDVAHSHGVPLIVDNTVATPYLIRPLEHGADIVVHSATKFIGGHGTAIAGAIVDGGTFDFGASGKHPMFTEPDPSYHGLAYWPALGAGSYIIKARVQLLRDLGAAISPFNAFLLLQGLETLSLRMERHFANAQTVAEYLEAHDQVESVAYAGLPVVAVARASPTLTGGGTGYGSVPAFTIKGGLEAGKKFVEALELHSHVANIGDVRRLVIHPAPTTHSPAHPRGAGVDRRRPGPRAPVGRPRDASTTSSPTSTRASPPLSRRASAPIRAGRVARLDDRTAPASSPSATARRSGR